MKAELIEKYDSVSVRIIDGHGQKLNLTVSRSGETVSGTVQRPVLKFAAAAFAVRMDPKIPGTYGDKMRAIHALAEAAPDLTAFIEKF